ncbi:MAG: hypothetical protein ACM3U2_21055 [Deltaproteobacteria bacterium]
MDHLFDEFSKSLGESVPRRESLRRLGAVFAGAVLGPLGLATASAGNPDPCKTFCKCGTRAQQSQCLTACRACNGNTSRIGGSCGSYVCCSVASCNGVCSNLTSDPNCGACGNNCGAIGETCCGSYCADLANDVFDCGACGAACDPPPPGEEVACISGTCVYDCAPGAVDCNGTCTFLDSDPDNCGACGNVCPASAPNCSQGICNDCGEGTALCGGQCIDILFDGLNCGVCGYQCQPLEFCSWGICYGTGG